MPPEVLHTCPKCQTAGFTARGLKTHNCARRQNHPEDYQRPSVPSVVDSSEVFPPQSQATISETLPRGGGSHLSSHLRPDSPESLPPSGSRRSRGIEPSLPPQEPFSHTASEALPGAEAGHAAPGALATGAAAVGAASVPAVVKPAKTIDLKAVDENLEIDTPALITRQQFVPLWNELTPEQCEEAIRLALSACESARRHSAVWDLRTGALLHFYKASLNLPGKRKIGFWEKAEKAFGVGRATISRKMRLVDIWAKELNASPETLKLLASTEDPTNAEIPAVKSALDWIGEATTSDLYRKHKLVNVGPSGGYRATKADGSDRSKKRTKAEIEQEEFELAAQGALHKLRHALDEIAAIHGPAKKGEVVPRAWDLLEDKTLEGLKLSAHDLHQGCIASLNRRAALRKTGIDAGKGEKGKVALTEGTEG